jgi:hypothetical protein
MHASRLLSILLRLQARGPLTASEMAEALEVWCARSTAIDQLSGGGHPGDRTAAVPAASSWPTAFART